MFNSYEKEKFVVGAEYYTYYMEETSKRDGIRNYTGIMKVKVISNDKTKYSPDGYTVFKILESKKLSSTIEHNVCTYMNGYGIASTNFYHDKESCIEAHDKDLIKIASRQSTKNRDSILKKVINKNSLPQKDKRETDAISWYNSLSKVEKDHVKWIKYYWDGI